MNIFSKIKALPNLTNSEKVFANYILESTEEFLSCDIKDIAKNSYVSTSTIYRFIEKLDVQGLAQLKVLVSSQYPEYKKEQREIDYNYPFNENDTQYQVITKMQDLYEQTIASTKNLIDLDVLLGTVQALDKADNIAVLPSVGNIHGAESFKLKMTEIGKHVIVETVPYLQYMAASALTSKDLAIVISYAGRGTAMLDIVKVLHDANVPVVLISSTMPQEMFPYATYHLFFCPYENDDNGKIASFTSRISLQYLLDSIFACYFNRHYKENIQFKLNHIKRL